MDASAQYTEALAEPGAGAGSEPGSEPYVVLLGEPAVAFASGPLRFRRDKRYYLLAFLACHHDWVARERLAQLFWPEHDSGDARHNLRQLFKRTRRLTWRPALEMSMDRDEQRVRWRPPTDLAALAQALAQRDWQHALRLYRGPLLAGFTGDDAPAFADWLEFERRQLRESWRAALMAHAAELRGNGAYRQAAQVLAVVLRQDEYDEDALRAYMSALTLAGNAKQALDAHDAFARRLETELRLMSSSATRALLRRIRDGSLEPDPAAVAEPSRALPAVVGPGAAPDGEPAESPATSLIGRELELSDLVHQLGNPACRLLNVTGPGGVGKSRIARHAITELRARYEDGAVFVALEALPATGSFADAIASALGLAAPDRADLEPLEHVVRAIGNRHLLLVLDNIEHLEQAGSVVSRLVAACPRLDLLATSRERLDLAEEWLLPIAGLAYPLGDASLPEALAHDAVRLFVQRAERVRPAFSLSQNDLPNVLDICRLVAGLPLGIEMAAAWLRLLPCRDVAEEIERDTDFLDRSPSNAAERHRSIRATFEYSWRRLARVEQAALRALVVFRGAFERDAGVHVAGAKLPVLAALVDRSLLRVHDEGRFSVHPLLRKYALEKLAAEPVEARRAHAAHGRYFLDLLHGSKDLGGAPYRTGGAVPDEAFEDVAAAWRWACAERQSNGLGLAAGPLAQMCVARARYHDGLGLLTCAVQATGSDDPVALGRLLVARARLDERVGRYREAALDAHRGLDLLLEAGDRPGQLSGMATLGKVAVRGGRYVEAKEIFTRALRTARAWELRWDVAQLSGAIGVAEQFLGRRARAAVWYRRSLALSRDLDDLPGVVNALANLGNMLRLLDNVEVARGLLDESLALAQRIGANELLPNLHVNMGVLVLDQGKAPLAAEHFASALQIARRQGNRSLEVNAIFQQGKLGVTLGDAVAGQAAFLESLSLADEIGHHEKVLDNVVGLAWTRAKVGDVGRATRWLDVALEHAAATQGSKRWALELRQALEPGGELAPPTRPVPNGSTRTRDGPAVARAVTKALARTAEAGPRSGRYWGA